MDNKYLSITTTLRRDSEPHQSSLCLEYAKEDGGVRIVGVLDHGRVLLPTKENIKALRSAARFLEKQCSHKAAR